MWVGPPNNTETRSTHCDGNTLDTAWADNIIDIAALSQFIEMSVCLEWKLYLCERVLLQNRPLSNPDWWPQPSRFPPKRTTHMNFFNLSLLAPTPMVPVLWQSTSGHLNLHASSACQKCFSLRSCRSSSVNFFWFFAGKFGKFSGKFGGNFPGLFWPTEQRLKNFGEIFGAFFVRKFVARKKIFRAKFTLQTCHPKKCQKVGLPLRELRAHKFVTCKRSCKRTCKVSNAKGLLLQERMCLFDLLLDTTMCDLAHAELGDAPEQFKSRHV